MRSSAILLTLICAAPAFAQAPAGKSADPAVTKVADAYVKATLAGDAKAIAALYTEDAVEMPPNQPAVKGRAAIEQYYTKLFADPAMKLSAFTLTHLESGTAGDLGFDVGMYQQTMTGGGGPMKDSGKYTVLLKRVGGTWKVAYAIYNSDQPPMTPPAAKPKS